MLDFMNRYPWWWKYDFTSKMIQEQYKQVDTNDYDDVNPDSHFRNGTGVPEYVKSNIISWYKKGYSAKDIAEKFKVSRSTVFNIVRGAPRVNNSRERVLRQSKVKVLSKQGWTLEEIASETGASRSTIYSDLRKLGMSK